MLALVTGEGDLPKTLIEHLHDEGTPYHLCQMEWQGVDARGDQPVRRFRIETLGSFIEWLKEAGVSRICFAGRVDRPPLDPSKIDPQTMPLVPRMMQALQLGDDAALRLVLGFFEEAGIQPVGAHEIRPDILPAVGVLTKKQPSDENTRDVDRAVQIIGAMAAADVGQACIVQKGQALAIEAQPGTDYMMQSVLNERLALPWAKNPMGISGQTRAKGFPDHGGILVKAAKPGQELRIDMPTIGPETILRAIQTKLDGVIVEAERVIILECDECIKLADKNDLFIWVRG